MPYTKPFTLEELKRYELAGKMKVSFDTVETLVKAGAKLTQECSSFSDPGEDYTAVDVEWTDGSKKRIAYWEGF